MFVQLFPFWKQPVCSNNVPKCSRLFLCVPKCSSLFLNYPPLCRKRKKSWFLLHGTVGIDRKNFLEMAQNLGFSPLRSLAQ